MKSNDGFRGFAQVASDAVGSPWAFACACALVVLWGAAGPFMGFSDTWQLIVNTGTSILTFLIVFLIQHAQNRDTRAIRLKLDELLLAIEGAQSPVIDVDRLSEEQMTELEQRVRQWHRQHSQGRPRQPEQG
jgi:low affinity Fe/Cu permease